MGWLVTVWLSYILSEADHRMVEVEAWARERMTALSALLPQPVQAKDFSDDRLADVVRWLSDDAVWQEIEISLGQRLIRVYDLDEQPVRVDATTVAAYHDTEDNTLFRKGHSKDHRPDLPQLKTMMGAIDPLGLPLATVQAPGNVVDDKLYTKTIDYLRQVLGQGGRLYIGDCKMSARHTRAFIHAGGDYYLTPLAHTAKVAEWLRRLLGPVWQCHQPLERISAWEGDQGKLLGRAYETVHQMQARLQGEGCSWRERLLVVYSPVLAALGRQGLRHRLKQAQEQILALTPPAGRGRRKWQERPPLEKAVEAILKKHRVQGLLQVSYLQQVQRRCLRKYAGRAACTKEQVRYEVEVTPCKEAIMAASRELGWRLYVTNAPAEVLPLARAVRAYRGAARIERDFARLKGRPLGVRPLYVQRQDHVIGMVRLLSLGLRVLTSMDYVVRQGLSQSGQALAGLYAGNPRRQTTQPTAERLLKAFGGIELTQVELSGQSAHHITPLRPLQRRILELLGLSASVYDDLVPSLDPIPP